MRTNGLALLLLLAAPGAQAGPDRCAPETLARELPALGEGSGAADLPAWHECVVCLGAARDARLKDVVARLRAAGLYDNDAWVHALDLGYHYLGDRESPRLLRAEIARLRPDSRIGVQHAIGAWEAAHPQPRNTSQAGFREHVEAKIEFLKQLQQARPRSAAAKEAFLQEARCGDVPWLSTETALYAADLALAYLAEHPRDGRLVGPARYWVARVYLGRGVRLEEVPRLVEQELAARGSPAGPEGDQILAEYWLLKGEVGQARGLIERARAELARLAPGADAAPRERDAFEHRQKALLALARRAGIEASPLLAARTIDWGKIARVPVADFAVTDFSGRRWRRADWAGKIVLVNLWATWCTPCRAELPYLEKLHRALAGRTDRLVMAVSIDSDTALARRFVREQGLTLPVVASRELADQIDLTWGVPANFLVDARGNKLAERVDWSPEAGWVESVRELMDRIGGH